MSDPRPRDPSPMFTLEDGKLGSAVGEQEKLARLLELRPYASDNSFQPFAYGKFGLVYSPKNPQIE